MKGRVVLAVLLLTAACAILRLPGLRAFPIFGDESIHLHWAQLIRERPIENAFLSLQDPKPPLHFWLLALFLPLSPDPVFAGRLLSLAGDSFNNGLRAYYFALAALMWFVHAWLMVAATAAVVFILYWREFRSDTLSALTVD